MNMDLTRLNGYRTPRRRLSNYNNVDVSRNIWERELQITISSEEWDQLFISTCKLTRSTKLRYFQYRLLLRKIVTNLLRSKWDATIDNKCNFCKTEMETMVDLFWQCKIVKLWKTLMK